MLVLKRIRLTIQIWFETRGYGFTLDDCWWEAGNILDRTESFNQWKKFRDK